MNCELQTQRHSAGSIDTPAGVFLNEPEFLDAPAAGARERGVKLELECFDLGMIVTPLRYCSEGKIPAPLDFQGDAVAVPPGAWQPRHGERRQEVLDGAWEHLAEPDVARFIPSAD